MLLTGVKPFLGATKTSIFQRTLNVNPDLSLLAQFQGSCGGEGTSLASDFISGCLEKNPTKRMKIDAVVSNEWFRKLYQPSLMIHDTKEHNNAALNLYNYKKATNF